MKAQPIDQEALASLHEAAWPWALHLARGDRDFAQDVLSIAYLAILEGKATWSGQSAFKTWVFGVIRMTCKSQSRSRSLLSFRFSQATPETLEAIGPSDIPKDPISQSMKAALAALPGKQAEILALVFGQDFTVEEAAEIMGVSLGTARTHYARAKASLRAKLDRPERSSDHDRRRSSSPV